MIHSIQMEMVVPDVSEPCEPFSDVGEDGEDGTLDEGERNGKWDGYSMINCDPIVLTDKDGYARIQAVFPRELCIWQSTDDETGFVHLRILQHLSHLHY